MCGTRTTSHARGINTLGARVGACTPKISLIHATRLVSHLVALHEDASLTKHLELRGVGNTKALPQVVANLMPDVC